MKDGKLYVDHGGWHECYIQNGAVIEGDAAGGFKPKERYNMREIRAKCGLNFGVPAADAVEPGRDGAPAADADKKKKG